MTKLERMYQMNVVLYFPTYSDVSTFVRINKKSLDAVKSLKINPWFSSPYSIMKFHTHFTPETMNCCSFQFVNKELMSRCVFLRNSAFPVSNDSYRDIAQFLFPKVTTLSLRKDKIDFSRFAILSAKLFIMLESLNGDIVLILEFCRSATENGKFPMHHFLKKIHVEVGNDGFLFPHSTIPIFNEMSNYLDMCNIEIVLISFYSAFSENTIEKLQKLGVKSFYKILTKQQIKDWETSYVLPSRFVAIEGSFDNNKFNSLIEKRYAEVCVVNMEYNSALKSEIERNLGRIITDDNPKTVWWEIPEYVKELFLLKINPVVVEKAVNIIPHFPADCQYLKVIKVISSRNVWISQFLPNLEKVNVIDSENVSLGTNDESDSFGLPNVIKILVVRSQHVNIATKSLKLREVTMEGSERTNFFGNFGSVKELDLVRVNNAIFPYFSFEKVNTNIQACQDLMFTENGIKKSPLLFINLNYDAFDKLAKSRMTLPNVVINRVVNMDYLKSLQSVFQMQRFFLNGERLSKNGDTLTMYDNGERNDEIDILVSTGFYMNGETEKEVVI
ncbi:hypothetical protein EIN_027100, partial [Entamoeba invadens IP1]|uniref:hypothetical protein n=1 Tax=Entamoeba invadens IP1 TaxID=370355 RepID=UPI0002C3F304